MPSSGKTPIAGAGSLGTLRELNRIRIVDALRRTGAASRSELAGATGLSRTTVGTVLADLLERGLAVEEPAPPGQAGPGRPAVRVRLARPAGGALGIDFGHRHLRVAAADLSSRVLAERLVEVDVDHEADDALDAAADLADEVLREARLEREQVVGAGMGLPGPVDVRTGTVGSSVILPGWAGLRAGAELARRLELPVEVDNDANLGARAEVAYGAGRGYSDVVYVKAASGIGAGIVLGGRLHRGVTGIAGEVGHVQVRSEGDVCRCGNRGCLETIASMGALLALLRPAHGDLGVKGLLQLLDASDFGARRVVNDAGRAIGRVLADVANTLNPEAIVVGGELSSAGAPLLDGIRESVDRYAQPGVAESVRVVPGELGERAELLGALALVVQDTDRVRTSSIAMLASD
jgi:predicted NBD/HSP70 family sugar kinase